MPVNDKVSDEVRDDCGGYQVVYSIVRFVAHSDRGFRR